ncbi:MULTISPECIES: hypothetical protein [Bacillus]|uniref:hypothetical protein n=1 Tax=Bacillaceae TaxID=186817 RepID=UPI001FAE9EDD|nr:MULTISPECIES: hypothetical protein [Bacillus]MCY7949366.1 hypothetical protein [Bacillus inaquosorum]MEC0520499.1 hypothetical protein [Bacillus inaquosorum]MEC0607302.1 hypothetical protein [Bacillus inaquosorum]
MGFKLPKEAREYFKLIDQKDNKFKTIFDKYYLCLMVGLSNEKLGKQDEYESADFVEGYPQAYADKAPLITGLLINAEMERQGINSEDRTSVEGLILQLIDNDSSTKLSEKGMELLNSYAAGGMSTIRDNIPKTSEIETFLVYYHRLLNPAS